MLIERTHFTDCVYALLLKIDSQLVKVIVVNATYCYVPSKAFVSQLDTKKITSSSICDGGVFYIRISEFT